MTEDNSIVFIIGDTIMPYPRPDRKTVLKFRALKKLNKRKARYNNILTQYYGFFKHPKQRASWYNWKYRWLTTRQERIEWKQANRYHPLYGYLCARHLYITKESITRE